MHRILCLAVILHIGTAWTTSPFAFADEEEETSVLDTIIVTGSVKEAKLVDTPASITVLTEKDIRNSGQNKLAELIASIPGVVNQRSGAKTYFGIRGTRGTLSPGATIYVDGRPINTGLYRYSKIDTIPLDNVEKIEIVKSPSPALYGANASRGVILISTRSGKGANYPIEGDISAEYGSWDTARGTAGLRGSKYNVYYGLNSYAMHSNGYRECDETVSSADGNLGYRFDGGSAGFLAGYNHLFLKYPTGLDATTAASDPESPGYINDDGYFVLPNETDEELINMGLKLNYDRNDWLLNASLFYTRDKQDYQRLEDQNSPELGDRQGDYNDVREENRYDIKIDIGHTVGTADAAMLDILTIGFDYLHSEFEQERRYPFAADPSDPGSWSSSMRGGKSKADIHATQKVYAISANNDFNAGKFRLITGGRLNNVKYEMKNKVPASLDISYNGDLDWNVSPAYNIVSNGNLFVAYNVSHFYLPLAHYKSDMEYDHPQARAEDLKPELYSSWETGFKHRMSRAFNYSVIYYYTTIEEKAVSYYDGTAFRGYRNAGTSIHQGIEIEVDGQPWDWMGYRISFTTIQAEWDEGVAKAYADSGDSSTSIIDLQGKNVYNVPEYEYSLGLDFYLLRQTGSGSLTASVCFHGFGEQYEDYNNNLKMDAAGFLDLKFTWLRGRFSAYINSTNVFDRQWNKYVNSTGQPHAALGGMGGIYPQDGRYVGIGCIARF